MSDRKTLTSNSSGSPTGADSIHAAYRAERQGLRLRADAAITRADEAEKERDAASRNFFTMQKSAATLAKRNSDLEARLSEAVKVLEEAVKGLDMVHNGLMDPTRPRQSVGEVCHHFLSKAKSGLATLGEKNED